MPRFGFVGPSYTVQSSEVAAEECINWFAETNESGGAFDMEQAYGGREFSSLKSYYGTPGLKAFADLTYPPRGGIEANGRCFFVAGATFWELLADGTKTNRGGVVNDQVAASLAFNGIQILVVTGGHAYCFTLATNALVEVTAQLAGVPVQCDSADTYFIVCFQNSNKYQMSQVLDGTTWPGQLVNEVSVFPDNIAALIVNHRELWIFGNRRSQPFQDTGSAEVFDPIPGALIEHGCGATFSAIRADNSVFWVDEDERGGRMVWRSNGYTPQRISTHAVEVWLDQQPGISGLTAYSYQQRGHIFYVMYVPGGDCTWVYDIGENLWHKRAAWANGNYQPHWSWNHVYCFGKHLVGDWNSGKVYDMGFGYYDDNGTQTRRLRQAPTVKQELNRVYHSELRVDFDVGLGPQPPLVDGNNAPRAPQAMLQISNDGGKTWGAEHWRSCGMAGETMTFVRWKRLGESRRRVYRLVVTDPCQWSIVDAYLEIAGG